MSLNLRQWLAERQIELNKLLSPGAEVSGVAFRAIQEMELKSLTPFDICAVADTLELPLRASVRVAQPIAQLTVGLLRLWSRKKTLKRAEGTWLAFQVVYLNALQEILEQEARLRRPWIDRANVPVGDDLSHPKSDPQLQGLLQTLRPGRLSDSQAEQALSRVGESFLVGQMNKLAIAWLISNGAEETEAQLLIQRLTNGLPGHLLAVIAENAIPLAQLQKFVRLGAIASREMNPSSELDPRATWENAEIDIAIDLERERYRSKLLSALSEPMLGAAFSLQDLYVPPKGIPLEIDVASTPSEEPAKPDARAIDLYDWVMQQLQQPQSIAAIEAESGWGKTSFCQILAARIARDLYPSWMPVFIRLRDVKLGQTLEQSLESALPQGRFSKADGWLFSQSSPLLLILDGLDELPPSPRKLRHHLAFIDQLMQFHAQALSSKPPLKHKILLASRTNPFEGLNRRYRIGSLFPLQAQWQRIVIQPMDREGLQQWFVQWAKLQSQQISQRYFTFLRDEGVFGKRFPNRGIALLVRQPLMLYLLGVLHRDGLLDRDVLGMSLPQAKFEIYERMTRWLLGETQGRRLLPEGVREGMAHANRGADAIANLLAGREPQQARDFMQQVAIALFQTGDWKLTLDRAEIEGNADDSAVSTAARPLPALFFCTPNRPLSPFLQTHSSSYRPITFSHISLGAYLAAGAIAQGLRAITEQFQDRYGDVAFLIDSSEAVAQHLYALLGYGTLAPEIEALAIESLRKEERCNPKAFSLSRLCARLERFYRAYCQGRWLDEGVAHSSYQHLQNRRNSLNVAQIDAAVGLNVFLLLCTLSRAASVPFWPCGNPNNTSEFDADRLVAFISRIAVLSPTLFFERARHSLSQLQLAGVCLNRAMLLEANLEGANLSIADLDRANLVSANLKGANLSWASLMGTELHHSDLEGANLEGANLSGANLLGANLSGANLANTCLFETQLEERHRQLARSQGAFFSREAFQEYSQSLVNNLQGSELLDLGMGAFFDTDSVAQIEVAEGEPILPNAWNDATLPEQQRGQKIQRVTPVEHYNPSAPTLAEVDPNAETLAEANWESESGQDIPSSADTATLIEKSDRDFDGDITGSEDPTVVEEGLGF
ncbi:MAG: pentapeptide repeat-containing protein [Cyanobacteriota bacterium]|nr:pentapeptide repeat-containing protein [Cyanobacteriota bacterium]